MNKKPSKIRLPISSTKEDLETVSRNKFSLLFDPTLFELRQEIQRDKGIDLIIEVKQDGAYTNFRFAIQLKSTASTNIKKDGSISFPVEVSNINYLLNYGMPAYYVLYEHKTEKFYLENVSLVYRNLSIKYANSEHPKKFSVRFSTLFTPELLSEIYQNTLENGILLRQLKMHLQPSIDDSKSTRGVLIDEKNEVYSVEQNIAFIDQFGFMLISKEHFDRIIEIEQRTHPRKEASAIFNLVCGVAYYQKGLLFKAVEFLKLAQQRLEEFSKENQTMLLYTIVHAKHLLGTINEQGFKDEVNKILEKNDLNTFLQLVKADKEFKNADGTDSERIQALYESIHKIISEETGNSRAIAIAYTYILDAEERVLVNDLTRNSLILCGRISNLSISNTYKQWLSLEKIYSKRLNDLLDFVFHTQNFIAIGELSEKKIFWTYTKVFMAHFFTNWDGRTKSIKGTLNQENVDLLLKYVNKLNKIIEAYKGLDLKESIVHCIFRKYELLLLADQPEEAAKVMIEASEIMETYELNGLKIRFNELTNGGTTHEKFIRSVASQLDRIYSIAKASGIEDQYIFKKMSEIDLKFVEQDVKWSIESFFEFQFPKLAS